MKVRRLSYDDMIFDHKSTGEKDVFDRTQSIPTRIAIDI
jgi:hypothetical protein